MKPTFALDLTRDTVALLHRTPKGWLSIGEVAFDAPDIDEALDYLRKTALGLSPMGMATKIILPASQILYTEVHAPGPSREEKRRQIAAGLEGRTPYPVEDLVFDWSGKGATVKVAVVARETLDEAEGFAIVHRLNPVSFVAIPEEGSFVGEAWFGPTAAAATILAAGEKVERDREPVTILHRELPATAAEATDPSAEMAAQKELQSATETESSSETAAPDDDEPLPGLEEALNADLPVPSDATPDTVANAVTPTAPLTPELEDQGDSLPGGQAPEPEPEPEPDLEPELVKAINREDAANADIGPEAPASDTTISTAALAEPRPSGVAPSAAMAKSESLPDADEAPFAHVTDISVLSEGDDDLPPALPSAAMVAFASRRSGSSGAPAGPAAVTSTGSTRPVDGATRSDTAAATSARLGTPAARIAPAKGLSGLVTAPSIPGTRAKPKPKLPAVDIPRPVVGGPTTVKSPARPGGTFGTSAPPRNRSGIVFMVLVALLLLFLALVAAWSSFFLARGDNPSDGFVDVASGSVPGIDDEMLADMQDPEGMTDPLPEADTLTMSTGDAGAMATESLAVAPSDIADEPMPEAAPEAPLVDLAVEPEAAIEAPLDIAASVGTDPEVETGAETAPAPLALEVAAEPAPEPAPETTITTELAAAPVLVEDQDEIFLSAMDAPPPALDALALPTPIATADALPDAPMPPPAFGTVYQFDANGLLKPTAAGILSPEGVMLIAGKPPRLPPARSEAAAALAAEFAATAAPAQIEAGSVEAALAEAEVPTVADASLVTAAETAQEQLPDEPLIIPADPSLAGFRPRLRPEGLVPATTDDDARLAGDSGSDVAVLRPLQRPAKVVAAASASRPAAEPAAAAPTVIADLGAQGASLAAQAEAQLAAAAALEAQNPSLVAISMRPATRPRDLSRAVEAAVAAAVRAPDPEPEIIVAAAAAPAPDLKPEELDELDEPEIASVAAPSIPTRASVAKQATYTKAINLKKLNLIGTYGTDSRRYALIRQSNGSYKKVRVGDKIDGGTIKAITETEVRYQKGGKLLALTMPKA